MITGVSRPLGIVLAATLLCGCGGHESSLIDLVPLPGEFIPSSEV
jgi:hypothetical protein